MTRIKNIRIRLTEKEHQQLKNLAGTRGISALLRRRALGPSRRQVKTERLAVFAEFTRIRNLLTQIARNTQSQTPRAQIEIVAQLIAVERELSSLQKS